MLCASANREQHECFHDAIRLLWISGTSQYDWGDRSRYRRLPQSRGSKAMIEYKGYAAAIEFDDSVGRLHGRIINNGHYPIATFEATDVDARALLTPPNAGNTLPISVPTA